ncbi:MAG: MauE/DoxX family redox-associated membrane protein [Thermomicrobiales bacterium]
MALSWLLLAIQLVLATVLLLAATGKALHPDDFAAALRLSHLPSRLDRPLTVVIPLIEFGLTLTLILSTPRTLPFVLSATAMLFGIFTVWMIWIRANHLRVRCGCFGLGGKEVGWRIIGRNGLLIVLSVAGIFLTVRAQSPLPDLSFWMVVSVTSVSMCVALVAVLREMAPQLLLTGERLYEQEAAGGLSAEE